MKSNFFTSSRMFMGLCLGASSMMVSQLSAKQGTTTVKQDVVVKQATLPSPEQLTKQLQRSLAKVRSACVAVYSRGSASGVIISEDGLVMTAGHVVKRINKDQKVTIKLENGESYKARKLGYNIEADIGLLQIENKGKVKLPFVKLAPKTAPLGGFVFTFSHPSGRLEGRPAQVRMGRVTTIRKVDGIPNFIYSDLAIQPGDSGGPILNLKGELVGIASSAASIPEFNIFGTIDQFYHNKEKLINGEELGDVAKSPMNGTYLLKAKYDGKAIEKIRDELMRRVKLKQYKALDFIKGRKNAKGQVVLEANSLINFAILDSIALANDQEVSMGLDDPALISKLPKLNVPHFLSIAITGQQKTKVEVKQKSKGNKKEGAKKKKGKKKKPKMVEKIVDAKLNAIALRRDLLLVKASEFNKLIKPMVSFGKSKIPLTVKNVVKRSKELDLLILKLKKPLNVKPIRFASKPKAVKAGQLLVAPDSQDRPVWNIATDESRIVAKRRSLGPIKPHMISKHRSPYPMAIRHALPLFAADVGTPVFDAHGDFVGMHIARFSRTMGLVLPQELIKKFYKSYLKDAKK